MKYFIVTFGCAANVADSERLAGYYEARGMKRTTKLHDADTVIIVTCMVRQSAEDRICGFITNLAKERENGRRATIILTGCMVGMMLRDKTGKLEKIIRKRMPQVDEFLPIEEVGFEYPQLRSDSAHAFVMISNGCNNFCSYCVVPYSRGREVSRSLEDIIQECKELAQKGYTHITLVGQNVNSYGRDFVENSKSEYRNSKQYLNSNSSIFKHLNLFRASDFVLRISKRKPGIPILFPYLLEDVCKIEGIKKVDFLSSNPWDFSDELINVIARNKKISRLIHLPVQSGDNDILKRMNRWYTKGQYLRLVGKIRKTIPDVQFSTDIIVGFPGEKEEQFQHTVDLSGKVGFAKAYISMYSDRPLTYAHKHFKDDVTHEEKRRRWRILENLINRKTRY